MLLVTYFKIRFVSAADICGNENTAESVKTNGDSGSHLHGLSPLSKPSRGDFNIR